jgi:hypothetical protein
MEIRNAHHDAEVRDQDEVTLQGFLAQETAQNPHIPGTAEYREWEEGHNLTINQGGTN